MALGNSKIAKQLANRHFRRQKLDMYFKGTL